MCLPQVIESFQNYRGVATTLYPTLVQSPNAVIPKECSADPWGSATVPRIPWIHFHNGYFNVFLFC